MDNLKFTSFDNPVRRTIIMLFVSTQIKILLWVGHVVRMEGDVILFTSVH